MQAIERAFGVLRALAEQSESAGVSEVARRSGLPKSTTSRILASLESLGMVERVGDRFAIGAGLATLTHNASPIETLRELARPYLVGLADELDESVALAISDGPDELVYVDTAPGSGAVQVPDWTGHRFPYHTVAAGFALMSTWTPDRVAAYAAPGLTGFTDATVTTLPRLRRRISTVFRDGVAWTHAEFADDVNGVAAPILGRSGGPVGAINASGPAFRFPGDRDEAAISGALVAACRQIGDRFD